LEDQKNSKMLTLEELEDLARNQSSESRRVLLHGLTDHFLAKADEYTEKYGDVFSDIILHLLKEVTVDARQELSKKVAPLEEFPAQIVHKLAHDEFEVASPVLELSPKLSDDDLISIASIMMHEHRLAISRRKQLGAKVTDTLARSNEADVMREMAGNPGATFSDATYRLVAERAKKDTELQEKLVERTDLLPTIAVQLTPFLSDELKEKLNLGKKDDDDGSFAGLLDSLSEFEVDKSKKKPVAPKQSQGTTPEIAQEIKRIKAGKADLNEVVARLAKADRFSGVCMLLAAIADLPEKGVSSTMLNQNGQPVAIACKAIGLNDEAFKAVARMRGKRLKLPDDEVTRLIAKYSSLKDFDSKKTLMAMRDRFKGSAAA